MLSRTSLWRGLDWSNATQPPKLQWSCVSLFLFRVLCHPGRGGEGGSFRAFVADGLRDVSRPALGVSVLQGPCIACPCCWESLSAVGLSCTHDCIVRLVMSPVKGCQGVS